MRDHPEVLDWLAAADPLRVAYRPATATDLLGYGASSVYAETFWLPIVGPSATFALRRLSAWLEHEPDGISVSIETLGQCLGVGAGTGRRAPTVRTLGRLVNFKIASVDGDRYLLRRELPLLSPRQIERLPACLITAHEQMIQGSTRGVTRTSLTPAPGVVEALPPEFAARPGAAPVGSPRR